MQVGNCLWFFPHVLGCKNYYKLIFIGFQLSLPSSFCCVFFFLSFLRCYPIIYRVHMSNCTHLKTSTVCQLVCLSFFLRGLCTNRRTKLIHAVSCFLLCTPTHAWIICWLTVWIFNASLPLHPLVSHSSLFSVWPQSEFLKYVWVNLYLPLAIGRNTGTRNKAVFSQ